MQRRTKLITGATFAVLGVAGGGIAVASAQDDDRPVTGADLDQASAAALAETGGGRVTGSEIDDEGGRYEIEVTLEDGSQVDVHLDDAFQVVGTDADGPDDDGEGDDDDERDEVATPEQLAQAEQAALAHVGSGTVTDREADDGGYEVEVTLADGSEVDVRLDAAFAVIGSETDGPGDD